jgi:hypothetical protein
MNTQPLRFRPSDVTNPPAHPSLILKRGEAACRQLAARARAHVRHARSLEQTPWFLDQADQASIFDNSGATPRLVGEKRGGVIRLDSAALSAVAAAVQTIRSD